MTGPDPMSETRDCGGDAAAYVLGALELHEAEAFRDHLTNCAVCRDELAAFLQVTDALPMAAPQHPLPKGLRRRVLGAVRADAKQASTGAWPRLLPRALALRPALASAALLAVAVATAGGIELASSGSSGTRVIHASVSGAPGSAEVRLAGGHAELIVHHLPQPASGRIYEVWLKRPHRSPSPTSALFSVTNTGSGAVGVPGDVRGISQVLVTQEPAGGSLVPTRPPVIVATLS